MVSWRSSPTSTFTRGAPWSPSRSTSQPWAASTWLRAAARQVVLAIWPPVTKPTDASARQVEQVEDPAGGDLLEHRGRRDGLRHPRVLVPRAHEPVGGDRRGQGAADDPGEEAGGAARQQARLGPRGEVAHHLGRVHALLGQGLGERRQHLASGRLGPHGAAGKAVEPGAGRIGGGEERGVVAGVAHGPPLLHSAPMRVWIDITNSPHVVIFRPLDRPHAGPRARGDRHRPRVRPDDRAAGALRHRRTSASARTAAPRAAGKARAMAGRSAALIRFARARALRPGRGPRQHRPAARRAARGHAPGDDVRLRVRRRRCTTGTAAWRRRVLVPGRDPRGGARALRHAPAPAGALPRAEGGVLPGRPRHRRRGCSTSSASTATRLLAVRAPAARGHPLPPRAPRPTCSPRPSRACWPRPGCRPWCCPAPTEQRARARAAGPAIVPERPVDGPSLVAAADLVVSAGGTMNREAAALGVPAYTPFAARLGAVDRQPHRGGPAAPPGAPRGRRAGPPRAAARRPPLRDPEILVDLILAAGGGLHCRRS